VQLANCGLICRFLITVQRKNSSPVNADHFTEYARASMQAENALLNVLMPWS
jgi:hypothetical protein